MYVKHTQEEVANVASVSDKGTKQVKMSVQQAHEKLGHINERVMKAIAKNLGWSLTDNQLLNCATCMAGKAKQKSLKKVSVPNPEDEKDGYRAYLDISMMKKNEKYPITTNPNWRMIVVGTKLQLKFSHFYKSKDAMVEPTCELLHLWMQNGQKIHKLHMGNAGESKKLELRLKSVPWENPVVIKYIARDIQTNPRKIFHSLQHFISSHAYYWS